MATKVTETSIGFTSTRPVVKRSKIKSGEHSLHEFILAGRPNAQPALLIRHINHLHLVQ